LFNLLATSSKKLSQESYIKEHQINSLYSWICSK